MKKTRKQEIKLVCGLPSKKVNSSNRLPSLRSLTLTKNSKRVTLKDSSTDPIRKNRPASQQTAADQLPKARKHRLRAQKEVDPVQKLRIAVARVTRRMLS